LHTGASKPYGRVLLTKVVFDDANGGQRAFRENWYVVGLADPATFYDVLANSAMQASKLRNDKSAEKESLWFHNKALQSVYSRLSDSRQATGEGIIGAVTGMICHAGICGEWTRWRAHMDGLRKILSLRGGIETVEHNKELLWTICWVDVTFAANQDVPTTFPFPAKLPQFAIDRASPLNELELLQMLRHEVLAQSDIWTIFDMFADFLNRVQRDLTANGPRTWKRSDYMYTDILPLLNSLLLQKKCQVSYTENDTIIEELLRVGMLLCLAQIRRDFGMHPIDSRIVVTKLRHWVDKGRDLALQSLEPILAWALVMGILESVDVGTRAWFLEQIETWVLEGNPATTVTKPNIIKAASKILWLDASHGALLHAVLEDKVKT
jgi:hypothetical protein